MVIVLAGIMAAVAFVVLTRLLWLSKKPSRSSTAITTAALVLILGLVILAASGRLHWIAAIGAALLPFLKRGFSLLRYLPLFRGLFGAYQQNFGQNGSSSNHQNSRTGNSGAMDLAEARDVLGLGAHPTRDEVVSAHRRLMQKVHPDRGGSTYLAQQLNEAKRVLLKNVS